MDTETSSFKLQTDFPYTFQCKSGELLFGQMQCIAEGMRTNLHDGIGGPILRPPGGTIIQNDFKYRVAARIGQWQVSRLYVAGRDPSSGEYTQMKRMIGYIAYHIDVSPLEYVSRASKVGISNLNKHSDKGIVYITRYDWSWHHGKRSSVNVALGPVRPYTGPQVRDLMAGRLILFDAANTQAFITTAKRTYLERKCYTFNSEPNQEPYGVQLDVGPNMPEYELGWLGFSGRKHERYNESDELVAIIYDPAYHGLSELAADEALLVESTVARAGEEVNATEEEDLDDPDYVDEGESEDDESSSEDEDQMQVEPDVDSLTNEIASLALPDAVPPPTISNITYSSGHTAQLSGSTLALVFSVAIDERPTSFKVKSNNLLEVQVPPEVAGSVAVTVQGPGGTSNTFQYNHPAVATVTSINPNNGPRWGGNTVTISGHHLERTTAVLFEDLPAISFEIVSNTQISAQAPAGYPISRLLPVTLQSDYKVGNGAGYYYTRDDDSPPTDDYQAALTTWKQALEWNPSDWGARCELWEVYKRKNDTSTAVNLWKDTVALDPHNINALGNFAKAYVSNGEHEAAIATWKAAIQEGADEMNIFEGMADAYEKLGDTEQAMRMRDEARRMWPEGMW